VHLRFTTVSDKTYRLQYKSEATASTWVTLSTNPSSSTSRGERDPGGAVASDLYCSR